MLLIQPVEMVGIEEEISELMSANAEILRRMYFYLYREEAPPCTDSTRRLIVRFILAAIEQRQDAENSDDDVNYEPPIKKSKYQ